MEPIRKRSAGGIVLGDGGTIALVQNAGGNGAWLFPKGKLEEGETDEEAARREIEEETGLSNLELLDDLGEYERPSMLVDGSDSTTEMKVIKMYLFSAPPHSELRGAHEIAEARWVPYREAGNIIGNTKERAFYASVFDRVREGIQRD